MPPTIPQLSSSPTFSIHPLIIFVSPTLPLIFYFQPSSLASPLPALFSSFPPPLYAFALPPLFIFWQSQLFFFFILLPPIIF